MQAIENQINASPLEVVHYHKEYVETGYQADALHYLKKAKAGSPTQMLPRSRNTPRNLGQNLVLNLVKKSKIQQIAALSPLIS